MGRTLSLSVLRSATAGGSRRSPPQLTYNIPWTLSISFEALAHPGGGVGFIHPTAHRCCDQEHGHPAIAHMAEPEDWLGVALDVPWFQRQGKAPTPLP